jgi:hypothetical protein
MARQGLRQPRAGCRRGDPAPRRGTGTGGGEYLAQPLAIAPVSVTLPFDNRFVAELPGDSEQSPRRRQVLGAAWSPAAPTPVAAPRLVAHAREVAELVGLTEADVRAPWFAEVFAGNACCPACSRTRRATAATSSATGPASSATGGRSPSARW